MPSGREALARSKASARAPGPRDHIRIGIKEEEHSLSHDHLIQTDTRPEELTHP